MPDCYWSNNSADIQDLVDIIKGTGNSDGLLEKINDRFGLLEEQVDLQIEQTQGLVNITLISIPTAISCILHSIFAYLYMVFCSVEITSQAYTDFNGGYCSLNIGCDNGYKCYWSLVFNPGGEGVPFFVLNDVDSGNMNNGAFGGWWYDFNINLKNFPFVKKFERDSTQFDLFDELCEMLKRGGIF